MKVKTTNPALILAKAQEHQSYALISSTYLFWNSRIDNYSLKHPTALKLRGSIIDWLYIINQKLDDSIHTFFLSIKLFDCYLSKTNVEILFEDIQLVASVCYFIAKKYNEVAILSISFVHKNLLKEKFTLDRVCNTEMEVLSRIKFRIEKDSIQSYTSVFIENIYNNDIIDPDILDFFDEINTGLNIFSLQIKEFIFEFEPMVISLITLFTTAKLLIEREILQEEERNEIFEIIKEIIGVSVFEENLEKVENVSTELTKTVKLKRELLKGKIYLKTYFESYDEKVRNFRKKKEWKNLEVEGEVVG